MNGDTPPSNIIGIRDVFESLAQLRGEVQINATNLRVELTQTATVQAAQALETAKEVAYVKGRMDGWIGALKWLGPAGVAALVLGVARMSGIV